METDEIKSKKAELVCMVADGLRQSIPQDQRALLDNALLQLIDRGVRIVPPEDDNCLELITLSSLNPNGLNPRLRGGESIKAGNITLDVRRLMVAGAQTVTDIARVITLPWLIPTTALTLWDRLRSLLQVKISDKEASVVWVLWMNCDQQHTVPELGLLNKVNDQRAAHGSPALTETELGEAIAILERMGCIRRSRKDSTRWWLREWVQIRYR